MPDNSDSTRQTDENPKLRALALNALGSSSGWGIFCRRFDEIVAKEFDEKIFDPAIPETERTILVRARKVVCDSYTPEKMRQTMLVVANNEIGRAERAKK